MAIAGDLPKANAVFQDLNMAEVKLGQLLFYDPILSGNKNVSCATCHHPRFGTGDGVSLSLGDGGIGLGPARRVDPDNMPEQRIPRNAPALFNLGAAEFTSLFHDGRLEADATRPSGIRTPLGADMEVGFASILSAQTMFPVLSPDEMAGHYSENDVSKAVRQGRLTGQGGAWDIIAKRVEGLEAYRQGFEEVIGTKPIHFTDISNAVAAFMAFEWRADNSPFDQYLRGQSELSEQAQMGLELFYGEAGCSDCHSGQFQTDHGYHSIGLPQFGPGKAARFESHVQDVGRMRVTGKEADAYAFRTPSLRHVSKTAPYGHNGAFANLESMIKHHLDPQVSVEAYDRAQVILAELAGKEDFRALDDPEEVTAILASSKLRPKSLDDLQIDQIIAFLETLVDPVADAGRLGIPDAVPSGLPIDR